MLNKKVDEINNFLKKEMWFDFEILGYKKNDLTVIGSTDFSYYHNIEIHFKDVFLIHCHSEWKSDTSKSIIEIIQGNTAKKINIENKIEQGYTLFKLIPEDMYEDSFFYIAARDLEYNTDCVLYYKKEDLKDNERIADWVPT
jgi:hypothetical protein